MSGVNRCHAVRTSPWFRRWRNRPPSNREFWGAFPAMRKNIFLVQTCCSWISQALQKKLSMNYPCEGFSNRDILHNDENLCWHQHLVFFLNLRKDFLDDIKVPGQPVYGLQTWAREHSVPECNYFLLIAGTQTSPWSACGVLSPFKWGIWDSPECSRFIDCKGWEIRVQRMKGAKYKMNR